MMPEDPNYPSTPGYGQPPAFGGAELASWGTRVGGAAIDYIVPFLVAGVIFQVSTALGALLYLAAFGWVIYNKVIEGQTGQSIGKKTVGIRLVREQDGQVVGPGLAIGRYFLHILDGLPCYLGYLWPLWDDKKQTFADKIVHTLVLKA